MKPTTFFQTLLLVLLLAAAGSGAMAQTINYEPVLVEDTIHWTIPQIIEMIGCQLDEIRAYPSDGFHEIWYLPNDEYVYYENPVYKGRLRASEDNARLFFHPADSEDEFLIMDMNLSIGDTFHAQNEYGQPCDLIVDSVYVQNGNKHIRFNNYIHGSYQDSYRMFIEGVGPNWSLTERFNTGGQLYVICKYNGDSLCYAVSDATFENCNFRDPCINEIAELEDHSEIMIYPNPFSDIITIECHSASMRLTVYDCFGRICLGEQCIQACQQVDMRGYSTGIYIVCLSNNGEKKFYKIIKEK